MITDDEDDDEWPACEHPDCGRIPHQEPIDVSDEDVEGEAWCITCWDYYREFG